MNAKIGEDLRELRAVAHRVEVAVERRLPADRLRLALRDHRPLVAAVRDLVHPDAVMPPEVLDEPLRIGVRELADRPDPQPFEPDRCLGTDAVDLARRQRPDARCDIGRGHDRDAVRLVEIGRDLREELVRREADRRRKPGRGADRRLDRLRERARAGRPVVRVDVAGDRRGRRDVREVDVDLVDAAILDLGRDRAHGRLEQLRVALVRVEVGRQADRIGREPRRLHEPHAGIHAERARFVSCGRRDSASDVFAQRREALLSGRRVARLAPAAADDDGAAAQFRIAQELDRRIERVHVEMCDETRKVVHVGSGAARLQFRRFAASLARSIGMSARRSGVAARRWVPRCGNIPVMQATLPHSAAALAGPAAAARAAQRRVAAWLFVCCALVFAMVVVGGVTRLTHSGLSIVEWQPIVGTLPPLDEAQWQETFAKYQLDARVPESQRGDEPGRVQGHLLVGILPPPARSRDRSRVLRAARLVCGAPRDPARIHVEARDDIRAGRGAGRPGLVHGEERPRRRPARVAVPADGAPRAGVRDSRGHAVDRTLARLPGAGRPPYAAAASCADAIVRACRRWCS